MYFTGQNTVKPGQARFPGSVAARPVRFDAPGIVCSMSRQGECHDNAVMESFFSRMKDERISHRKYRSRDDARGNH
jgi:hypothetical protein